MEIIEEDMYGPTSGYMTNYFKIKHNDGKITEVEIETDIRFNAENFEITTKSYIDRGGKLHLYYIFVSMFTGESFEYRKVINLKKTRKMKLKIKITSKDHRFDT